MLDVFEMWFWKTQFSMSYMYTWPLNNAGVRGADSLQAIENLHLTFFFNIQYKYIYFTWVYKKLVHVISVTKYVSTEIAWDNIHDFDVSWIFHG